MSRFEVSRRELGLMLLALPAAGRVLAEEKKPEPSPQARFVAAEEPGLSPAEREALLKSVSDFEKNLATIRDFKLPPDVPPAVRFAPLKSRRR